MTVRSASASSHATAATGIGCAPATRTVCDFKNNRCVPPGCDFKNNWFVNLYLTLLSHPSQNVSSARSLEDILLDKVRKIPCIPLSDGSFTSISDGRIWLPYDVANSIPECSSIPNFPALYGNLRTVSPNLLSACCKNKYLMEEVRINDLADMLQRIGVRKLSGHDIVKNHIMVSLCNGLDANVADIVIREYVSFIMVHLQSSCTSCNFERGEIVSELRKSPIFLTNHGYKAQLMNQFTSVKIMEIPWMLLDSSECRNKLD